MAKVFDAKHPIESFKALVLEMMKVYRFDVEGLFLKGGTVRPLPSEASAVGVGRPRGGECGTTPSLRT